MKKALQLLLLLASPAVFSQINFEPGYFVNDNGKKTECLIRNVAWKNTPETFDYKLSESGEIQTESLRNVKEFSVGTAYRFKRFVVDIDRSNDFTNRLTHIREPQFVKDTIFLKTLVDGKATLYHYEEPGIIKYFYSTGDHTEATQLFYKRYIVGSSTIKENNNYRQQLFLIMKDEMPQASRYERVKYKKDPLVKLFMEYNGDNAKNMDAKHLKGDINLKLVAGGGLGSLTIANNYNIDHEFDKGTVFMAGAELEYILPFNKNKWSMFVMPNVQFYNATSSDDVLEYEAKYSSFQIGVGGRHYMFLTDKSKLFIDAAYNFAFQMGDSYIKYNNPQLDISKATSLTVGAGFNYGPYSAAIRHTFKHGITEYVYWDIDYSTTAIVLSYNFL